MTEYQIIYDSFLAKILEDEWCSWEEEQIQKDMRSLLEGAISHFLFCKVSLERDDEGFLEDLTSSEIQILAYYMKYEWLCRKVNDYRQIGVLYDERDFSQANYLDKLIKLKESEKAVADRLLAGYHRSRREGGAYDYSAFGTRINENV